jgi:hypothetical protein
MPLGIHDIYAERVFVPGMRASRRSAYTIFAKRVFVPSVLLSPSFATLGIDTALGKS